MDLVLNHCGVPSIASGEIEEWKKDISTNFRIKTCNL